MTDNEYSKTRKAAVDALIYWAKTGMREFTMRDAVNDYLEATDWRLTAYMLCPRRIYPKWTGRWRESWGICRGKREPYLVK